MSDLQLYNLLAGLAVVVVLWGSLGFYALRTRAREAENHRLADEARKRVS